MKNKKIIASLVFFGTLAVVGAASLTTFGLLLKGTKDSSSSEKKSPVDGQIPILTDNTDEIIKQTKIFNYAHLGLVKAQAFSTSKNATIKLTNLLPYVGKSLNVDLFNAKGETVISSVLLKPTSSTEMVKFNNLVEKTDYLVKVNFSGLEIASTKLETKITPKISFISPNNQYPQGQIILTNLQSYTPANSAVKLYIAFKNKTDEFFGEEATELIGISKTGSFWLTPTMLQPGAEYNFKLIQVENGMVSDVLAYSESFKILQPSKPTLISRSTDDSITFSLYGLTNHANKTLKARYRIKMEAGKELEFTEVDLIVSADGTAKINLSNVSSNLSYEFVVGQYQTITSASPKTLADTSTPPPLASETPPAPKPPVQEFIKIDLSANVEIIKTKANPTITTTLNSYDSISINLNSFDKYLGEELTLKYVSQKNTSSQGAKKIVISQTDFSVLLQGLEADSDYSIKLVDKSGKDLLTSFVKTYPNISFQRFDAGVKDKTALLKFKGGKSYLNQDLALFYKKIGSTTQFEPIIINVKTNSFEVKLENLDPNSKYEWKLMDSGRNFITEGNQFTTLSKPTETVKVIGNFALITVDKNLAKYVPNGIIYLEYWQNDKAKSKTIVQNLFTDTYLGSEMMNFTLSNLDINSLYNYQIYGYQGPIKEVISISTFNTTSNSSNVLSISNILQNHGDLTFGNLGQYDNKDLMLEVVDIKGNKKFQKILKGMPKPTRIQNLYSNSEYTINLYVSSVNEEDNAKQSPIFTLISSSKIKTLPLTLGILHAPVVTSSTDLAIDTKTIETVTVSEITNQPSKAYKLAPVYKLTVNELESYKNKTLVLKYWDVSQSESSAVTDEIVLNDANTNWYTGINFLLSTIKFGLRYNFVISTKETTPVKIWENFNVLIQEPTIANKTLTIDFANETPEGFRAIFKGFDGAEGKSVLITTRPLKNETEAVKSKFNFYSNEWVNERTNLSGKIEKTIEQDGTFFVDYKYADIAQHMKVTSKGGDFNINEIRLLQFFVQDKDTAADTTATNNIFYKTPLTRFFVLPSLVASEIKNIPTSTKTNQLGISLKYFTPSNEKFSLRFAKSNSYMATMNVANWNNAGSVDLKTGETTFTVTGLEQNTSYDVKLLDSFGRVLGSLENLKTVSEFVLETLPSKTRLKINLYNPNLASVNLTGKTFQILASTTPDFGVVLRSPNISVGAADTWTTVGSEKVIQNKEIFAKNTLKPDTTYYYKVVEIDKDIIIGNIRGTFSTLSDYGMNIENVTSNSVDVNLLNLNVSKDLDIQSAQLVVQYSKNADFSAATEYPISLHSKANNINFRINELDKNTTYYFKIVDKKAGTTLTESLSKLKFEIKTLIDEASSIAYKTKATLEIVSDSKDILVRYGTNGLLNLYSKSSAYNRTTKKATFQLDSLIAGTNYNYEILNSIGKLLTLGSFSTKDEQITVTEKSNSSTSQSLVFSNIESMQGETVKVQYRLKSVTTPSTEISWTSVDVKISQGVTSHVFVIDGLTAATKYEYKVIYQPGAETDGIEIKPLTSFTTLATYTPEASVSKISNTITTMANFSRENFITVATLADLNATTTNWLDKIITSLKNISITSQREKANAYTTSWFEMKKSTDVSETESPNTKFAKFKVDSSEVDNQIKALFFFQNDSKKLNWIEIEFKLVDNLIQAKVGTSKWATLSSATEAKTVIFEEGLTKLEALTSTEIVPKQAMQNGLKAYGYARTSSVTAEDYITVSGLRFDVQKVASFAEEKNTAQNSLILSKQTTVANISESTQTYFDVNDDLKEKSKTGTFAVGNSTIMLGSVLNSNDQSLFALGIKSIEDLENSFANNSNLVLTIKSDLASKPQTLFAKDFKITKEYAVNSNNEPTTAFKIFWKNGMYFEGITLHLGVNIDAVATLSQKESGLRLKANADQTLENMTWDQFLMQALPVADNNTNTGAGIGIVSLAISIPQTAETSPLSYKDGAPSNELDSSLLEY